MSTLRYIADAEVGDLLVDTCVFQRDGEGPYWLLWFYVRRDTDGIEETMGVLVNPNGGPVPPAKEGDRRVWGLKRTEEPGIWQVSPSIDVKESRKPDAPSIWHHTLTIVDVPEPLPWERTEG